MANQPRAKKGRRSHRTDPVLKLKSIFFLSIHSKKMPIFCVGLCISLAMTIGILTVYFTAPRPGMECDFSFKRNMKSSLISSSQPRSIAFGQLNNDHEIDFVVTNSGTDTIGVFIAHGNGTFAHQVTYRTGTGSYPCSLAVNDFNNDSYADIVVANYGTNNIGLLFGYENGTFDEQKVISLGSSHPLFVTTADFNNDNRIDIAVVNNGTNIISILLGYGNGSFQQQTNYSTDYDSLPSSLAVGDFDNDTYLDIVVANSGTNNIGIFLNYGNGTFQRQQIYTTTPGSNPRSVAAEDLNKDNIIDVVVANYGGGSVGIFFGQRNGVFLQQVSYEIGTLAEPAYPQYVTISDMDKDNVLDIIIVDSENDRIHVLPGYGNGSLATTATYDGVSESMPVWIVVHDFNNNNQSDVVVVNNGTNNVVVLMDYFTKPSARQTNSHVAERGVLGPVAAGDFNNDGIIDIVFKAGGDIGIFMGSGAVTFNKPIKYSNISGVKNPQYMCTGDVNNDHRMDIIIADPGLDSVDVFLGYGNGSFGDMISSSIGIGSIPFWVALGDFNDDNVLDIVSANHGTDSIGILIGNGNGSFALRKEYFVDQPLSVAVGEINNDNHLDIVVSTNFGSVDIFVGQGNGTFILKATYLTGFYRGCFSLSLADFNKDNHLDIVVANTGIDNVGVLLGYGNGTFAPQTKYSTGRGSGPLYVIVADCNKDNISDIMATNTGSHEIVIFYGYRNGSFELSRNYSTGFGSKPWGIVTADLNNDTHLEFVVALNGLGDIAILTEYYAAQFDHKTIYSTGAAPQPTSVAIGDFNNDNRSDIVITNSGRDSLSIFLASTNGTFGMEIIYPIGTDFYPQYVITCDIDKDNHIDIVSVNSKDDSISVIMGYGNGSFAEQSIYSTGDGSSPQTVAAGDLNNDNRVDLVIANSGTDSIGIFYGYNYTSFQSQRTYASIDNLDAVGIIAGDFNNDNILDIAATFQDSDSWCILLGYRNGSFTITETYFLPEESWPKGIDVGDFNNDNQSDIVIANIGSDNIGVYLGYGNGSFATVITYSTGNNSSPTAIANGDFNNDSRLDIVVTNGQSDNVGILLGYGNGSFTRIITYPTGPGSYPRAVTVADLNNDGRLDIAVADYATHNVGVLFGHGDGTFANQLTFSSGSIQPSWITVGDFDMDKQLDAAVAAYNDHSVFIVLGYGNGSFAPAVRYPTGDGSTPSCISTGDFNNDNISDIAVANYGTNNIVVLFGLGDGSFLLGSPYSTGTGSTPARLVTRDFNEDGRLDIAVANERSNTIGIFLGNDSQPFGSITTIPTGDGSQPHSVALGNFNNDSWLDIVVANYGANSIGILLGINSSHFEPIHVYATGNGSLPYSVAVSDFNNDTHLDIVASNSGTDTIVIFLGDGAGNFTSGATYSTGIRSRPYTVTIGDFNKDNISDIAVANYGTSNILLLYGYGNGTFRENELPYSLGYGYLPYSLAVGDLSEDGKMDMAIACYGTDHVETLIQMC